MLAMLATLDRRGRLDRWKRLLASARVPWIAAAIAVLLFVPALGSGLVFDDFAHRADIVQPELLARHKPVWDLFDFQGPDRRELETNIARGTWPWWTPSTFRLAFFRPLSGLSHVLDYTCFVDRPSWMHAENIALFALSVLLAGWLYRRFLGAVWTAGLATLLFAVDDAHGLVVGWIANRNAVLAAVFAFAAVLLHDRARRDRDVRAAILAPLAFAGGLLAGEAAAATIAYLVAYALFLDTEAPRRRAFSLLPYACVVLVWAVVYKALGYGAAAGGFYIDPGAEPLAFVGAVAKRLPVLLLAQLAGPPAELWPMSTEAPVGPLVVAAAVVAILFVVLASRLRADKTSAFFGTGLILSLVPVCATWPSDRLLLLSGLGAFGLVASFLGRVRAREGEPRIRLFERVAVGAVAAIFVLFHVVLAPVFLPLRTYALLTGFSDYVARGDATMPADMGSTLVVLNAPDTLVASYVIAVRAYDKRPYPQRLRVLGVVVEGSETIERVDDHTLSITPSASFLHDPFSQLFRSPALRFHAGEVVEIEGMRVEIARVDDAGRPTNVRFRFDAPLDDPGFTWVAWEGTGFLRKSPPRSGETLTLAGIDTAKAIFGR